MENILANENNSEFKYRVKQTWIEWLSSSTTHALPKIGTASSQLIRITWILSFLVAASYCLYSIIILVVEYFAYETIVNLVITDPVTTDFPAV